MQETSRQYHTIVIGAGASGVLVAIQFARAARAGERLVLVDAGARAARGLAYGTPYGAHLLNVRASRMSALPDEPAHFAKWLEGRQPGANEETFAPRALYGTYLAELLEEYLGRGDRIARVGGTAVGITRSGSCWVVHLHDGRTLASKNVVLALGNLPPADPLQLPDAPDEYLRDPWAPGAALGLAQDAAVLFIGTGLTMVDLALALRHEGHRGEMHAISRHGQLPRAHKPYQPLPVPNYDAGFEAPIQALRRLREEIRVAEASGYDWRAVIDALRPITAKIWGSWSLASRGRFLRHAKTLWDIHRHRMAPEVAARLEAMRAAGMLKIHAGKVLTLQREKWGLAVRWRPRGQNETKMLRVGRVINCTGPAADYAKVDLPLVAELRHGGWLKPDGLGLGVETDAEGRVIGSNGLPVAGLWTLGPLRRPALWESTAIPEIRTQAGELAQRLAEGS